ncbi:MAG TPA: haloacid dehalogenase-like hydrolase [Myxococcota bacterium]|nr:haloacid dehalogenase-like hydrolase [Myxococcota bacterium]HRY95854.1 haloacid dehalogenase-like hydrolase [Myxococcota bacterium]
MSRLPRLLGLFALALWAGACCAPAQAVRAEPAFQPVPGFPDEVNQRLARFLEETRAEPGRKVAVFDGDGTVFGQAPHYLADECLYLHAQAHPDRKPELIQAMSKQVNVSIPYVQDRVRYLAGLSLVELRQLGVRCFREHYADKFYPPMRALVDLLQAHGFEVWVVTGSPEALYQQFIAEGLGIPPLRVVGVKSIIRGGVVTDEIVPPVPQDAGKLQAIETFIQERPLLVGGNSRGDREMIEHSRGLKLIVNPDEHVEVGSTESIAEVARREGWLTVRIRDVPAPDFPWVTSRVYGVRVNKTHEGP